MSLLVLMAMALALAGLAFVAVLTVLFASRRSIIPFQQIKSAAVTMLWIAPALVVVGTIGAAGLYFTHTTVVRDEPGVIDEYESRAPVRRNARSRVERRREQARSTATTTLASDTQTSAPPTMTVEDATSSTAIVAEAGQITPVENPTSTGQAEVPTAATAGNPVVLDSQPAESRAQHDVGLSNSRPTDGVLKVLETRAGSPDWAEKDPQPNDRGILVALSSQRFATQEEAARQLTAMAASYIKQFYHEEYPLAGDWTVPLSIIERTAVQKVVGETLDQDFGNGIRGTMYRAHVQLEMNSALRKELQDSWHGQIVSHRLTVLGSMLGLVTLMLATSAGYFRLDELTGGLYRRRLKFAAASLVAAGSLVALVIA